MATTLPSLPEGWQWKTVAELAAAEPRSITDGPFGSKLKTEHYTEAGPRVIRLQNIGDGEFLDAKAHISEEHYETLKSHKVEAGDIVIAAMGENPPRACIVPDTLGPAIVKADCIRFKPDPVHSAKFLTYSLNSPGTRRRAKAIVHGVGRPRLNQGEIKAIELPVAPPEEQVRIVARIEELFSRLDAGVAALRQAKAQLQRYRQSVLAAAVTGQLTEGWREQHPDTEPAEELLKRILEQRREKWNARGKYTEALSAEPLNLALPSTWTTTNIDSVISGIEAGKNFKCEERPPNEGETGLVKISAVTWGRFDELESKTVTSDDQIRDEHVIHSGDFLLSRANTLELVGAPVIVEQIDRHLMLSDKVLRLRFIERLEKFALFWLRSKLGRKEIESRATGNQLSMRNIAQASLRAIPLPLPPLAEQHQIVFEVESRTTAIDHLEAELDRQIVRSNCLRQSILAAAFSGKSNISYTHVPFE